MNSLKHKIAFMTTLGINVGDEFIREGICSFLDDIFAEWHPYYVNKHDLTTLYRRMSDEHDALGDKFRDADIIIQAGAPVYWKIGESTSYNVEWAEELWRKRIFRLGPQKPILNIAAGACQPYPDTARTFLSDPQCVEFAKKAAQACAWTSVRDPLASQILYALDIQHDVLPCSAFHAARRMEYPLEPDNVIGINLMPCGGHFRLRDDVDNDRWMKEISTFLPQLRQHHPLLFIAHDQQEKEFMEQFRMPGDSVFLSPDYREHMRAYSRCKLVVANRVHGGVCAAGFGRPAIIIGNDTRLLIGDFIGLPSRYVGSVRGEEIVALVEESLLNRKQEEERLITLREESAVRYRQAISEALSSEQSGSVHEPELKQAWKRSGKTSLSGVGREASEPGFHDFMTAMNCFARRVGLREEVNTPRSWAYPWLWFSALRGESWFTLKVLDVGSGLSPMPWFLASLGARVTLVAPDSRWEQEWKSTMARTGLTIDWQVATGDALPFSEAEFDVVTCYEMDETLGDVSRVVAEMTRVLNPGGLFATCTEAGSVTDAVAEAVRKNQWVGGGREQVARHCEGRAGEAVFARKKLIADELVKKILVPRFDALGDLVLLEGLVERLRGLYPDAAITMLVRSGFDQLADLFPPELGLSWLTVDQYPYVEPAIEDRRNLDVFIDNLVVGKWDLVVFTAFNRSWIDEAISSRLDNVLAVALENSESTGRMAAGHPVCVRVDEKSLEIQKYQNLLSSLTGCQEDPAFPRLVVPGSHQAQADVILEELELVNARFLVCVPAGTQNQAIKVWPTERFVEVISWTCERYNFKPLLVGHENELDQLRSLERLLVARSIKPALWLGRHGDVPILAALMQRARICLSNDTGPLHMANALGVPVVGIYGGGTFPRFLVHGTNAAGVAGDLPCFGCYWQCCFGDAPCMRLVTVRDVTSAVQRVLEGEAIPGNLIRAEHSVSSETAEFIDKCKQEAKKRTTEMQLRIQQCQSVADICDQQSMLKESEIHRLHQQLTELRNSLSWRWTEPVRRLMTLFSSRK